jgi:hypothetical protein
VELSYVVVLLTGADVPVGDDVVVDDGSSDVVLVEVALTTSVVFDGRV